jgi:hypothetical protein
MAVSTVETKPKISAAEKERRLAAVRYAVAHNRIEGQYLDAQGAAIFDAFVRGEIDKPELRQRLNVLNSKL